MQWMTRERHRSPVDFLLEVEERQVQEPCSAELSLTFDLSTHLEESRPTPPSPAPLHSCSTSFLPRVSGLSPFMGDNDNETLANVTSATWDFDDEAFDEISDDAKDFISNLLKKDMK